MLIIGDERVRVPVRVVTRRGEQVGLARPRLTMTESIATFDGMTLACTRDGTSDAVLSSDDLAARFHLVCRRARFVQGPGDLALETGGAAQPVRFSAAFASGELAALRPYSIGTEDTLVARFGDGQVIPARVGRTSLHADLGGARISIPVAVTHVVARDTLELRPGEFRTWALVAGRYDITVKDLKGSRSFEELEMFAEGTKCVPSRLDRDMIHCLVGDTAVIVLQNRHPTGVPPSPQTAITIIRTH
jgi:hypothetical protein